MAGYLFPQYSSLQRQNTSSKQQHEEEDKLIERMNKAHEKIMGGNLMVPMLRLNLLDNTEGMDLDYTIEALEINLQRATTWRKWLSANHSKFGISGATIFTAREDRNMLSIALSIDSELTLGERELGKEITPLLDGSLK